MIKQIRKLLFKIISVGVLLIFHTTTVQASGMQFTVAPIFSPNQFKTTNYFNLLSKPGTTQKVTIRLTNTSDERKSFSVRLVNATTTNIGEINYTPSKTKTDASAKVTLRRLCAQPTQKVILASKEQRDISFELKIPRKGLTGQVLGSIYVLDQTHLTDQANNLTFQNHYAMVTAVQLQTKKTLHVKPRLKLVRVTNGQIGNVKSVIKARLQNPQPTILRPLKITAQVKNVRTSKIIVKHYKLRYTMAPTSHADLQIPLGHALKKGRYRVKLVVKRDAKQTWYLTRYMNIKS